MWRVIRIRAVATLKHICQQEKRNNFFIKIDVSKIVADMHRTHFRCHSSVTTDRTGSYRPWSFYSYSITSLIKTDELYYDVPSLFQSTTTAYLGCQQRRYRIHHWSSNYQTYKLNGEILTFDVELSYYHATATLMEGSYSFFLAAECSGLSRPKHCGHGCCGACPKPCDCMQKNEHGEPNRL